jgi:hypothetical protein
MTYDLSVVKELATVCDFYKEVEALDRYVLTLLFILFDFIRNFRLRVKAKARAIERARLIDEAAFSGLEKPKMANSKGPSVQIFVPREAQPFPGLRKLRHRLMKSKGKRPRSTNGVSWPPAFLPSANKCLALSTLFKGSIVPALSWAWSKLSCS